MLVVLLVAAASPPGATAEGPDEDLDDLLLLPEFRLEYEPTDGMWSRTWRRTTNESAHLLNATLSDAWNIAKSPLDWRTREWLTFIGVAGGAAGLIYLADQDVRDAAVGNETFARFGDKIGFLSDGTGFLAISGGFLLAGSLFRDKEIETGTLLIESVALGYVYGAGSKYLFGRRRPGDDVDVDDFKPFSGRFSMPSGETTHAFAMASVVAEQYPNWPVRILSYGLAATVAAGRIARDDHWLSDVFVAAALGTFMGKSVTWLNAERGRRSEARARLGLAPERERFAHSFRVSTRSFQWNVRF